MSNKQTNLFQYLGSNRSPFHDIASLCSGNLWYFHSNLHQCNSEIKWSAFTCAVSHSFIAPTGALLAALLPLFLITSSCSSKYHYHLLTPLKDLEHVWEDILKKVPKIGKFLLKSHNNWLCFDHCGTTLSSLGFVLSERTSGVSPVIFGFLAVQPTAQ